MKSNMFEMKTKISVLLFVILASTNLLFAQSGTCGTNLTWELSCDSVLTINGRGVMDEWTYSKVPWASYRESIKSVVLSDSITSIGGHAFQGCVNLEKIIIPNSVTSIGDLAFRGCDHLTSIEIPSSVINIGDRAFYNGCPNLLTVTINSSSIINGGYGEYYENINGNNYKRSYSLKDVFGGQVVQYIIGDSIKNIGNYAFGNCDSLRNVVLPEGLISIGDSAFCSCKSLISINIPNSVASIGNYAFRTCKLETVILSDRLERINNGVFLGCSNLTSIIIPDSVKSIGLEAFRACGKMTSVHIGKSVERIEDGAFRSCNIIQSLEIPSNVNYIGQLVFLWCDSLVDINVAEDNPYFCSLDGVLFDKDKHTLIQYPVRKEGSFTIPASVDSIAGYAFYGEPCYLTELTCEAVVPPILDHTDKSVVFSNYNIPLYVRSQSIDAYKAAEEWNRFDIRTIKHSISVYTNNSKYGSVEGSGTYKQDTTITITAIPNKGYQFNQWSDGNTDNPRQVIVTQDSVFTAIFGVKMCSWLVESNDLEMGAVITSFNNAFYQYGTQITVEASPNSGYKFVKWNDGKKFNPYKFSILDDKYLLAIFMEETEEQDTTTVIPTSTTATFTWPFIIGGFSYSLTIYLDAACTIPFCTITFNQYGQFIGISFGNRAPRRYAEQEDGFTYTVSGLDANTEYYFKMETMDENNKLINTDEGSFRTQNGATAIEYQQSDKITPYKVMINGQIFILRGDKIYSIQGQEVK